MGKKESMWKISMVDTALIITYIILFVIASIITCYGFVINDITLAESILRIIGLFIFLIFIVWCISRMRNMRESKIGKIIMLFSVGILLVLNIIIIFGGAK